MSTISEFGSPPCPLVFMPVQGKPEQLFVLLHGESAAPEQLSPLAQAIRHAFPQALLVLPHGSIHESDQLYHWLDPAGLNEENSIERLARALPALVAQIQQIQTRYGLSGQRTALAGFSQGATMALEADLIQPDLAGRVLAFSGSYRHPLRVAPLATTLHFLHGANDAQVPVEHMQSVYARLAELEGDATLDVASGVGHELHGSLISRAVYRLQTCVPLRSWEAALTELNTKPETLVAPYSDEQTSRGKTLH